jgi:predicted TIM-barrel fold metal-dependent hydrolase
MIWDVHTHLYGVEGRTPDERMTRLLHFADRLGIERVCVFMGYPFAEDPTPEELRRQNDQVVQALSHYHDRAFGFVYLSGHHPEASLRELDRCVRDGPMVGVKLWVARRASVAELDAIVGRAAELRAPILQHTWFKAVGNRPGESTPLDLAELAKRHPDARLICGHTGGDWELGIRAIRASPNVVAETAGFDPTAGMVEMAVRELGPERVLFGSDAGGRSFASQLAKVQGADVPDSARRLILGENLRRLLTPILRGKGVTP